MKPLCTAIVLCALTVAVSVVRAGDSSSSRATIHDDSAAPIQHPISSAQILHESFRKFLDRFKGWDNLSLEDKRRAWFSLESLKFDGDSATLDEARDFLSLLKPGERAELLKLSGKEFTDSLGLTGHAAEIVGAAFEARVLAEAEPLTLVRKAVRLKGQAKTVAEQAILKEYDELSKKFQKYWAFYKKVGLSRLDALARWAKLKEDLLRAERKSKAGDKDSAELALDQATKHALQMWEGIGDDAKPAARQLLEGLRHGDGSDGVLNVLANAGELLAAHGELSDEAKDRLESSVPGLSKSFARVYPEEEKRVTAYRKLIDDAIGVEDAGNGEQKYVVRDDEAYDELARKYAELLPWAVRHGNDKLVFALAPKDEGGRHLQIGLRATPGFERSVRAAGGVGLTPNFHGILYETPNTVSDIQGLLKKVNQGALKDSAFVQGPHDLPTYIAAADDTDLTHVRFRAPRAPKPPPPRPEPEPNHDQDIADKPNRPVEEPPSPELDAFCHAATPSDQICAGAGITKDYGYTAEAVNRALSAARGLGAVSYSRYLETLERSLPDGIGLIELKPYAEGEVREALRQAIAQSSSWLPPHLKRDMDQKEASVHYVTAAEFMRRVESNNHLIQVWNAQIRNYQLEWATDYYKGMVDDMCHQTAFNNFSIDLDGTPLVVTCPGARMFAIGLKYEGGPVNDANYKDSITFSLAHEFGHHVGLSRGYKIYDNLMACLSAPQNQYDEISADYWAAETIAKLKPNIGRNAFYRLVKHAISVQCGGGGNNGDTHPSGNWRVNMMSHNPRLYDRLCPGLRVRPLCGIEGPVQPLPASESRRIASIGNSGGNSDAGTQVVRSTGRGIHLSYGNSGASNTSSTAPPRSAPGGSSGSDGESTSQSHSSSVTVSAPNAGTVTSSVGNSTPEKFHIDWDGGPEAYQGDSWRCYYYASQRLMEILAHKQGKVFHSDINGLINAYNPSFWNHWVNPNTGRPIILADEWKARGVQLPAYERETLFSRPSGGDWATGGMSQAELEKMKAAIRTNNPVLFIWKPGGKDRNGQDIIWWHANVCLGYDDTKRVLHCRDSSFYGEGNDQAAQARGQWFDMPYDLALASGRHADVYRVPGTGGGSSAPKADQVTPRTAGIHLR